MIAKILQRTSHADVQIGDEGKIVGRAPDDSIAVEITTWWANPHVPLKSVWDTRVVAVPQKHIQIIDHD